MDVPIPDKRQDGVTRRDFLRAAAAMGAVGLVEGAMSQIPAWATADALSGAFDLHVHTAPDVAARSVNDLDLAKRAKEEGMRGILLKNHEFPTHERAYLVREAVPGIEVFGGIALNEAVGGINPSAVAQMGKSVGGFGKVVWLPTRDAAHHRAFFAKTTEAGGIRVIDRSGKILPQLRQILRMVAAQDIVFATGHVSPEEVLASVEAAREEGVRRIVVTHALQSPVEMTLEGVGRCVEQGAFIEHAYLGWFMGPQADQEWMRSWRHVSLEMFAQAIRTLGADRCLISSDLGQPGNPHPTDGLKDFLLAMKEQGITEGEIDWMVRRNPARLLGLIPLSG